MRSHHPTLVLPASVIALTILTHACGVGSLSPFPATASAAPPTHSQTTPPKPSPWAPSTSTPRALGTLSATDAIERVSELLETNGGCELPCWWGIEPGRTRWSEAKRELSAFGASIDSSTFGVPPGITGNLVTLSDPNGSAGEIIQQQYIVRQDVVQVILSAPRAAPQFQLRQLLSRLGVPGSVFLFSLPQPYLGHLPVDLLLHYPEEGITAVYSAEGTVDGQMVVACSFGQPYLWLWPEASRLTVEDVSNSYPAGPLPSDFRTLFRPLSEVSDLGIESFVSVFESSSPARCLETPSEAWR